MRHTLTAILAMCFLQGFSIAQDNVLTTAAANGSFKTLTSLVVAADLDEALQSKGAFTVFAPTDEAFAKLPKETLENLLKPENRETLASILKYHVLPKRIRVPKRNSHPIKKAKTLLGKDVNFERDGSTVSVNDAKIVQRNIECSNGLIHVVDNVLLPPEDDNSIVGTAEKAGNFTTLLKAANAAGLVETLSGKGPLTVFAPNDDAFKAIPKETLASLLKPENKDQLVKLLSNHVVLGKITAREAVRRGFAKTLSGEALLVKIKNGKLFIAQSNVVANDLEASNGLIHVIDKVLVPESEHSQTAETSTDHKVESVKSEKPQYKKEITITSDWDSPVNRDGIKCDKLIIRVAGAGRVRLTNVDANEIKTTVGGGGYLSIQGVAGIHTARINGGGDLRAKSLVSETTKVRVNGGGSAVVNATEILDASANAGADIKYVNTNAKITKSINKYAVFSKLH